MKKKLYYPHDASEVLAENYDFGQIYRLAHYERFT